MSSSRIKSRRRDLRGSSIVPLMTPFTADGSLDADAVGRLIDHVVDGGCQGILVAGTTGEAASMSLAMRSSLIGLAIRQTAGRARVFAGIGDNSFQHSVALARDAFAAGADAVVAHLPSCYPISATEMEAYFGNLADRVEGPLYIYNIPQTSRLSVPFDVVERLSHHPRIAGIKDSEPDVARQQQVARQFAGREDFAVFCGSIPFTAVAMRSGADGFVPSAGNLVPRLTRQVMDRWTAGDEPGAIALQEKLSSISAIYQAGRSLGQSLSAMKAALAVMGLCSRQMLPPLRPCTEAETTELRQQLEREHLVA